MGRLPPWFRIRLGASGRCAAVEDMLRAADLHTVCESAQCPNRPECFGRGTATLMILGEVCTRGCLFCAVRKGVPAPPDPSEPERAAEFAAALGIRHVVVTSVTRDDLADGGAGAFAATVRALRNRLCCTIEVLTPDFRGERRSLDVVLKSGPDVFNHNLETVERLQPLARPQASYTRSLAVLRTAADRCGGLLVKSGLMAGMGETDSELERAMADLLASGCRALTLGQYLAPSPRHLPVRRYLKPEDFESLRDRALKMGFRKVAAGPLVRSSYRAGEMLEPPHPRRAAERNV